MIFHPFKISENYKEVEDTHIIQATPQTQEIFSFLPGQYCLIRNPAFLNPEEEHPFSVASSPHTKDHLEFCIKAYGDWTRDFVQLSEGAQIFISEPQGSFVWDDTISDAVFLLGGIGISPIMSMLRYIEDEKLQPSITILYGNRTPDTIAYGNELERRKASIKNLKTVDIFSHLPEEHPWTGYRGFITDNIISKEVNLTKKPVFFIVGPPIFIDKMQDILKRLKVDDKYIKKEILADLARPTS